MSRSLDALYERFGIDPKTPIDATSPEVQRLLATSLDGSLFRSEMIRFADEIAQLKRGLEHERDQLARVKAESSAWIRKLEGDIASVQSQLTAESASRAKLESELFEQRNENERVRGQLEIFRTNYLNIPRVIRRLFRKKPFDASA